MRRTLGLVCGASLLLLHVVSAGAAQKPDAESTVTVTATIEAIDKANRTVTLKRSTGTSVEVKAPDDMEGFNSLRVGDQVTTTYFRAMAVDVRKPGSSPPSGKPLTTTVRKDRTPGSETRRQQTFTGTIEAINPETPSLAVTGAQGRVVEIAVRDATVLQGMKVGETVDVTYYESLLVKVARPQK